MLFINNKLEGETKWWQYMLTIVLSIIGMTLGGLPFIVAITIAAKSTFPEYTPTQIQELIKSMDYSKLSIDPNLVLALMLLQFIFGLAFLYLMVRVLHKKRFESLISAKNRVNWKKMLLSFFIWFGLMIILEATSYLLNPESYQWNFHPSSFFMLLVIAIFFIPLQTSFEELFIRGYIMPGIGLIAKNRWIPIILSAIIFAALHGANPEIRQFGLYKMLSYYFLIGVFFAIIAVMDDGLEIPMGFHAANNIFAATIVSFKGSALQTPALFYNTDTNTDWMILGTTILIVLILVVAKKVLKWGNWSKLWSNIYYPNLDDDLIA